MISRRGQEILTRRKYRLVELLLFSELPWFENAVLAETPDPLLDAFRNTKRTRITESDLFNRMLDNIFNYHNTASKALASQHSLLEKIRMMQLLTRTSMASSEVASNLRDVFGYEITPESLVESLAILIRTECLKFHFAHGNRLVLSATARAKFLISHLCNEMSYLNTHSIDVIP